MSRPNVVLITIDECKASAMSPYGNSAVMTPTAKRMAEEGVVFENAFVCHTKCVPSRACLLSGRYAGTGGHRTLPGFELRGEEINLSMILKSEGYTTAMFGKNHTVEPSIIDECFDYTEVKNPNPRTQIADYDIEVASPMWRAFYRGKYDDVYDGPPNDVNSINQSVDFINNNADKPFFLLLNCNYPHPVYMEMQPYIDIIRERGFDMPVLHPHDDAPETLKAYRKAYDLEMLGDDDWEKIVASYLSMTSYIDNEVGRVLDALDDSGLSDNTIVVYTSDHGDFAGEHGCSEKYDTFFYECLIKVPLFIKYPRLVKSGQRFKQLNENVDIMPTILDMLDLKIPAAVHGKSMLPIMTGKSDKHKTEVFCEGGVEKSAIDNAPHYDSPECSRMWPTYYWKQVVLVDYPDSMQRSCMVRNDEWKFIYRQNGEKELYNLVSDPNEITNLSGNKKHSETASDLKGKLIEWMLKCQSDYPPIESLFA